MAAICSHTQRLLGAALSCSLVFAACGDSGGRSIGDVRPDAGGDATPDPTAPGSTPSPGVTPDATPDAPDGGSPGDGGVGEVTLSEFCGNGQDDNGNGEVDEGCICGVGDSQGCWTGAPDARDRGACVSGTQACEAQGDEFNTWAACEGETLASEEVCGNAIDDDCDGRTDEDCCRPGETRPCWEGDPALEGVGACQRGTQSCEGDAESPRWGACEMQGEAAEAEICHNAIDDDCDGEVDEGCPCRLNDERRCYGGDPAHENVGICLRGFSTCTTDGSELFWTECEGWIAPQAEVCGDALDTDCDGEVDEGCECTLGERRPCYPGPAGTAGRGICQNGEQTCVPDGEGATWGDCVGAVIPRREVCGDERDTDCDGDPDNGCECELGQVRGCYSGPPGTDSVGTCRSGRQTCAPADQGLRWGECLGEVTPGDRDACGDALDTDCDGEVDEGCLCVAGDLEACYGGPAGTEGVGTCGPGARRCEADGERVFWGECQGDTRPREEICGDGVDQDCNGADADCPPVVDVGLNLDGDCLRVCCPPTHPFPVGCNLNFRGGDPRGCVAYTPPQTCVYLQEGDVCGAGRVVGTLRCSTQAQGDLNANNCPINKRNRIYGQSRRDCPDTD